MKYRIFMAAAALMALTACTSDNDTPEPQQPATDGVLKTPITITAAYGDADAQTTRTAYTESGSTISATWQEDDEILVLFDGHVNTLALTDGAGTATATFSGTILGTPTAQSLLSCYVRDANNPDALTVSGNDIIYSDAAFLAQDGTLAAAAKCNTHSGSTTYGNGTGLRVAFAVNTSMLKFTVLAPFGVADGTEGATLTYTSGTTTLAKATFTVGAGGTNTIYMAVPAGQYTGAQTLVYQAGETVVSRTLSASKADFKYGQTYSREVDFDYAIQLSGRYSDYTASDGDVLKGTLVGGHVYIPDGATVTFRGMDSKVFCQGSATIILADGTTNTVTGFQDGYPGINVPSGKTLTIKGTGSLNVEGYRGAAAIGGDFYQSACGNIVIEGGNITAYGGEYAAGIGSGGSIKCTCGDITITGGNVTAYGGEEAAGIGSGSGSSCGTITISGGSVTATKGNQAPYSIGKGADFGDFPSSCGIITIGGTVYYDGTYFLNDGNTYLADSPFTWPTP